MADVTVNIRGNANQLRDELNSISSSAQQQQPTTSKVGRDSGSSTSRPSNDRMIEDIRREMQQRGVVMVPGSSEMTRVINMYGESQKSVVNERITEKYNARRDDMRSRMNEDYDKIEAEIERMRNEAISNMANPNDPLALNALDSQLDKYRESRYRRIGTMYDEEEEAIDNEERNERITAETELTNAIKELTEYFNRQSEQGNGEQQSFIGRLRSQQQELIRQRDSAETEEDAVNASRRLAEVNEQLRRTLGGERQEGKPYFDSLLQGTSGINQLLNSMQSGDLSGILMGGASSFVGLSGMGLKSALRFLGIAGVIAGGAKWLSSASNTSESLAGLASYRSTVDGLSGADARHYLWAQLPDAKKYGLSYTDIGIGIEEFAEQARRRIASRGMTNDWFSETISQIGLERSLALSAGSLERGSAYDRYGQNVTDAITRLVTILSGIEGSGVSFNDFSRVQEKYDIQQMIMSSMMNRTDRPDYNLANKMVAGFSSVSGITQDSRMGGDIEQFQSMIQNPFNERMKALVYGTVADLFPESGGRMDLIDRALKNPENEGKIMKAVVDRIVAQFGGTDTQMGYFAFKTLLPNISPDRRDEYIKAISGGDAGKILSGEATFNEAELASKSEENKRRMVQKSSELYATDMTKFLKNISDDTKKIAGYLSGTRTTPRVNLPKSGGNK